MYPVVEIFCAFVLLIDGAGGIMFSGSYMLMCTPRQRHFLTSLPLISSLRFNFLCKYLMYSITAPLSSCNFMVAIIVTNYYINDALYTEFYFKALLC